MNKIKVILFDNDGVLAHTEELFFEINGKVFAEMGIEYPRIEFEHHTFLTNLGTSGFMKNIGCGTEQIDQFKTKRDRLWQYAVTQTNVTDEFAETIFNKLKMNYTVGIVTNTNRENFTKTHHNSKIPELADFVVLREDYLNGKPEPDSYLKALEISNCIPSEAIVIEDSPRGITAAKAAGIKTIVIPNPVIKNLDASHSDYQISSLSELPDFLKTI
jgi:HAD superfamily hydrolase (TIGR01509 family)